MIPFKVYLKQNRPPELLQKEINNLVRIALKAAAEFWIKEFLPLHFQPGAVQRYSYAARRARYNAIKVKAENVIDWATGAKKPRPKPAAPLVWSGSARDSLLSKSPDDFNIKIAATSNKQTVRVPLHMTHPMKPQNASEPGRLIKAEVEAMQAVAIAVFAAELDNLRQPQTKTIGA